MTPAARAAARRGSPPVGGPLDQAGQQAQHARREERRPPDVDAHRPVAGVARQQPEPGHQPGPAEHDVDQEHGPPAQPEQVGVDQQAGQQRAADRRQPQDRAEGAERLADVLAREHRAQHAEALRDQQRPEPALDQPGHDDRGRIKGQAAGQRGGGEPGEADQEGPAAAVLVAQPPAGDQQHSQGQRVARAQPLDQARTAVQRGADGRRGDGGDGGVEQVHDVRDQDDGQDQPGRRGQPGYPAGRLSGHFYAHRNLLWRAGRYPPFGGPGRLAFRGRPAPAAARRCGPARDAGLVLRGWRPGV